MRRENLLGPLIILVVLISLISIILTTIQSSKIAQHGSESTQDVTLAESTVESIVEARSHEQAPVETSASAELADEEQVRGTVSGSTFSVLTFNLGSTTVVTDSGSDDDCSNGCPTKPLAQYVKDLDARAGMNGTYFCPPDYSWCSGKVNSYDFPVWNNRKKKWMQATKLFWSGRGMFVFRPGSAQFFANSAAVGAPSDITGGIVNYPSLLAGGQVVLNEGTLSDNLKVTKGTRSGIGIGGGKLFLVVARRANMGDMVRIFQSLGATDALNLDGGGSVALYQNGRYKVGPGRSLPNAIIVK